MFEYKNLMYLQYVILSVFLIVLVSANNAYADCDRVSRVFIPTNSAFSFTPGKAFFDARRCEWRRRIRIPDECNANLIAIDGTRLRPERIDIIREADNRESLSRTTTALPNGAWTYEQNNFICNSEDCRSSIYRIETSNEVPNFVCFQTITVTLELFD